MDTLQEFLRASAKVQAQAAQARIMWHPGCSAKTVKSDQSRIQDVGIKYQSRQEFVDYMKKEIQALSGERARHSFVADLRKYEEEYAALDKYHREQESLSMLDVPGRRSLARVFRDSGRPPPPGYAEKYDQAWEERRSQQVLERIQAEAASRAGFHERAARLRSDHGHSMVTRGIPKYPIAETLTPAAFNVQVV